jgi:WD40 repeat protein/energy-coupling factor transporter ATP-binding protein EcfA2
VASKYDVFLSHNIKDKFIVAQIGRLLQEKEGLRPFLDKWHLVPGKPWQEEIEEALQESKTVAVFVGPHEIGTWHNEEMRVALNLRTQDPDFSVIPVLLPGANMPERGKMPPFLSRLTWVDLRGGIEDEDAFARLVSGIRGVAPGDLADKCGEIISGVPYRGLEKFGPEDAPWFFGRESETQQLIEKLKKEDFIAILGASGSGKSSVALAGLVPAVQQGNIPGSDRWPVCILTPKYKPLEELSINLAENIPDTGPATLLNDLRNSKEALYLNLKQAFRHTPKGQYLLLVVDQFEEIFTLCEDEVERRQFIDNILHAARAMEIQLKVVITMRADFLAKCTPYPQLADTLANSQFIVTPMDESQMRLAISMPARLAGLKFEEGLVERIIADIGDEPGGLPLMQYCLFQLWENRQGNRFTCEAYDLFGGVSGAISQTADRIYASFDSDEQALVKQILLALVQLGEGTEDTRRRVPMSSFTHLEDPDKLEDVVQILTNSRLMTSEKGREKGGTELQVAHEALIRNWDTLRTWIDENRENLKLERRIQAAAEDWEEHGKPNTLLLRGPRLAEAREWSKTQTANEKLSTFMQRSQHRDHLIRFGTIGTIIIVIAALITAVLIFNRQARENALLADENAAQAEENLRIAAVAQTQARENALLADENAAQAEENLRIAAVAQSNELTIRARNVHANGIHDLSGLLALEAINITFQQDKSVTPEAFAFGYYWLNQLSSLDVILQGHTSFVTSAAFSPDGSRIVTTSWDGTARVWSLEGEELAVLEGHTDKVFSAAFSPDGSRILTASADEDARVWSLEGEALAVLEGQTSARFSPDGSRIVTVSWIGTALVWSLDGEALAVLKGNIIIYSAAFSPDGSRIVTLSTDGTARVWSLEGEALAVLGGHGIFVNSAAFSPDGSRIVTASDDGTARVWSLEGKTLAVLEGHTMEVISAAFSPDSSRIVTASIDWTAMVWSLEGEALAVLEGHAAGVNSAAFSPDGSRIVTASDDGTARVWSLEGEALAVLEGHTDFVKSARFSPDGSWIVTASNDGTARVWPVYDIDQIIASLQHKVNRELTEDECQIYLHRSCDEN